MRMGVDFGRGSMLHREFFDKHLFFKLGNGLTVRFWEDQWHGGQLLRSRFPLLSELSRKKGCTVAKVLSCQNGNSAIDIEPSRRLLENEILEAIDAEAPKEKNYCPKQFGKLYRRFSGIKSMETIIPATEGIFFCLDSN